MKVKYEDSIEYKLLQFVAQSTSNIILRDELSELAGKRQINRALNSLVKQEKLAKIGYGIYVRLKYSEIAEMSYLPNGFVSTAREALTRLGVKWDLSSDEKAYNEGLTQQVPINPSTKLLERFRRKISYNNMELRFE